MAWHIFASIAGSQNSVKFSFAAASRGRNEEQL
jgi:hypothetical protein